MTDPSVPRDSRRVPLETRVQLKFEKFSGFINEFSANLSPGGIFIRSDRPEPVGALVDFEFRLGDGFELIRGRGEVAWVREASDDPAHPAGMGLRFQEISPQGRDLIYKVVDRHIQAGGVPFDPTPPPPPVRTPDPEPIAAPLPLAPRPPVAPLVRPTPQEPPIRNAASLMHLFEEATASVAAVEAAAAAAPKPIEPKPIEPKPIESKPIESKPIESKPAGPAVDPPASETAALPPLERSWGGRVPILAPPPDVPMRSTPSPLDDTLSSRAILIPPEPSAEAKQRRQRPWRLAIGFFLLSLALAGIGVWRVRDLWWDDFFGEVDPEPLPAAFAHPERKPMYPSLPGRPALGVGSPAPKLVQETAVPNPNSPAPAAGGVPPVSTASPVPPLEATVPTAPGVAPPKPSTAAPTVPVEAPRPVLETIRSITVRALEGETEIVLEGDGIIRSSNYARFRIDSGSPRELIRFKGIRRAYAVTKVAGGTPELSQIRVGYHSPDELHVVLDLSGPEIELKRLDISGARLVIRLGRKR